MGCGLGLAFFVGRTFVFPLPAQYRLDFGPARWIQTPGAMSERAAYFRKLLYIDGPVQQAWMQISATGIYTLFVNGKVVDVNAYPGARPSGVYDLTTRLVKGNNVIAVWITAGKFPGPGQVEVRGAYFLASSPPREFYSDSSWKASSTPDGIVGGEAWNSRFLDDTLWLNATETFADEYFSTVQPVSFDPSLFQERPRAQWIGSHNPQAREVAFLHDLELPFFRGETWIRVAATGDYDLIVNGWKVTTQAAASRATGLRVPILDGLQIAGDNGRISAVVSPDDGRPGTDTPVAAISDSTLEAKDIAFLTPSALLSTQARMATRPDPSVDDADFPDITPPTIPTVAGLDGTTALIAYNLTPWVKTGANSIVVRVRSELGPALLLADSRTYLESGRVKRFASDGSWLASCLGCGSSKYKPVDALILGNYGAEPWGQLPQVIWSAGYAPNKNLRLIARWAVVSVVVLMLVILLWLPVPLLFERIERGRTFTLLTHDALLHLPTLSLLLLLWLLSYDVRLPDNFCFTPTVVAILVALLLASKFFGLAASVIRGAKRRIPERSAGFAAHRRWQAAVCLIVVVGFIVRAYGLLDASFSHDEAGMALFSAGVLKSGYPYATIGSFTKWLTTYVLVAYPLALSSLLLGKTLLAYRLPALIFGTLTIGLLGWAGYRMFDRRVGLLAALVYAFLPAPIAWARDGFYPSQEAFFAFLTFWLFYEAIREEDSVNYRYLNLSALTFVLTYLSWSGSGFILPTLFILFLISRWRRFDWIADRSLWRPAVLVSVIVIAQLCFRELLMIPNYLGVIFDLSEVSTPWPVFLSRLMFMPFYYITQLFLSETHTVMSLLVLFGCLAFWKNQALRYVSVALLILEAWYTLFLMRYAPRYSFQAQPLLVLAAAAAFIQIVDAIRGAEETFPPFHIRLVRRCSVAILLVTLLLSTNAYVLKDYRLGARPLSPPLFERATVAYKPNYRDADRYIAEHLSPGDVVISRQPHVYTFYTGRSADYSSDLLYTSRIYYDGGSNPPRYIDKAKGLPVLLSIDELGAIPFCHQRLWVLMSNHGMREYDRLTYAALMKWGRVVLETSHQQVVLIDGIGRRMIGRQKDAGASDGPGCVATEPASWRTDSNH
jgi:hypothetical protein